MKQFIYIFIFFILLSLNNIYASEVPDKLSISGTEMVDKISTVTSLSKETVELLYKENPEALSAIESYLYHLKLFDLWINAKDVEALTMLFTPAIDNYINKAMEYTYPTSMLVFIKAIKVYSSILEGIRDLIFIPSLENTIYQRYKTNRTQQMDQHMSFTMATSNKYYPAKQKMFDNLLKARSIRKDLLTDKLEKYYWNQIDTYWMNKLEARLQFEQLKANEYKLKLQMHKHILEDIDKVRELAKGKKDYPSLFINPKKDLPNGWWQVQGKQLKYVKEPFKSDVIMPPIKTFYWSQKFKISDGVNYQLHKNGKYFRFIGGNKKMYDLPYATIFILIRPRYMTVQEKNHDFAKQSLKHNIEKLNCIPLNDKGSSCKKLGLDNILIAFYTEQYYCKVDIKSIRPFNDQKKPDLEKYTKLGIQLSKIVAKKMQ